MKTNITSKTDNIGTWYTWLGKCDKCGKTIHNNGAFFSLDKPDENETDFCCDCLRYFIDMKIPPQVVERKYGKNYKD